MWRNPAIFEGLDWGRYYENGSYHHFQEPRHSTVAITEEAVAVMKEHKEGKEKENPLFLYVSYNAAHSPLQPEPEWEAECGHIPHLWRRQFCGLMVGLDRNINRLVDSARDILGENTVVVVSSDNGGSVWFGGLNAPLRAGKVSTFEGGVRVPAFMLDFSSRYSGTPGQELTNMFHISDWLPTFLSWANHSHLTSSISLDGLDQSLALVSPNHIVREGFTEVTSGYIKTMSFLTIRFLNETFLKERDGVGAGQSRGVSHGCQDSVYSLQEHGWIFHYKSYQFVPEDLVNVKSRITSLFRKGQYKIIQGAIPDPHWYSEPQKDLVGTSDTGLVAPLLERLVRVAEAVWGNSRTDFYPHLLLLDAVLFKYYSREGGRTLLFDIKNDPEEKVDISSSHPEVLSHMLEEVEQLKHNVQQHKYWMVDPDWIQTFVPGDCSAFDLSVKTDLERCMFAHPWLPDSVDLFDLESFHLVNYLDMIRKPGESLVQ